MWNHRFPRYSLRGDPNQPAVTDFGSKNGRFPALAFGASAISTAALSGTVPSFVLFPSPSRPDRGNIEADALIIRWVEPQQSVKNTLGLLEPFQSPQAQPEAVHAAQERAVVEPSPGQESICEAAQREFADPQSHLVVAHRIAGDVVEDEVTGGSRGVEAAELGLAKLHEDWHAAS